jgi:high-affinity Fe2+/Pb2+ permease
LHIKSFFGTNDNAVRVQVWIAISVYVLVAIVRKELGVDRSLSAILQILSLTLFEKTPIFQALSGSKLQDPEPPSSNQLNLFDL